MTVSQTVLACVGLDGRGREKLGQDFVGFPPIGIYLLLLGLDWGSGLFGRMVAELKCHLHHIVSRVHTVNMPSLWTLTCFHWGSVGLVSPLLWKWPPPPPPLSLPSSSEGSRDALPTFKAVNSLSANALKRENLHKLFGILLHSIFVSSAYLLIDIRMDLGIFRYLFYVLGYTPTVLHFVALWHALLFCSCFEQFLPSHTCHSLLPVSNS